jgi:hypothetical protein
VVITAQTGYQHCYGWKRYLSEGTAVLLLNIEFSESSIEFPFAATL